ncbi:MAG: hypothetical protein ACYTGR_09355 [Planctomycetota bacterium]|jgi:hypothetical protein
MKARLAILLKSGVPAVLVLCLQICCCHSDFVVGLLGGDGAASERAASCCGLCAENESTDAPGDEAPARTTSCKICCVKGSGLKHVTPLPQIAVAFVPEPVVVVVSPTSDGRLAIAPASTGPPDVGDASLLRQHCALIV